MTYGLLADPTPPVAEQKTVPAADRLGEPGSALRPLPIALSSTDSGTEAGVLGADYGPSRLER